MKKYLSVNHNNQICTEICSITSTFFTAENKMKCIKSSKSVPVKFT